MKRKDHKQAKKLIQKLGQELRKAEKKQVKETLKGTDAAPSVHKRRRTRQVAGIAGEIYALPRIAQCQRDYRAQVLEHTACTKAWYSANDDGWSFN